MNSQSTKQSPLPLLKSNYSFVCPGCGRTHELQAGKFHFNGDTEKPTFTPPFRIQYSYVEEPKLHVCHLSITNGVLSFDDESTHRMRGQSIQL